MTCARFKEVFDLRIFRPKGLFVAFEVEFLVFNLLFGFCIEFAGEISVWELVFNFRWGV